MITYNEASAIANKYLVDLQEDVGESLQVTEVREKSFGWVYFYHATEFLETGALSSMLAGNAPFIANRRDGTVHVLGTAHPVDVYLEEYELIYP